MVEIFDVRSDYMGTGNLAAYTFDFHIYDKSQLRIIEFDDNGIVVFNIDGTDLIDLASVTFDSKNGGGTVTLAANLPTNYKLSIILALDEPIQDNRYSNQSTFKLENLEKIFDYFVTSIQRLAYRSSRSVVLHEAENEDPDLGQTFDPTLPFGMSGAGAVIPSTNPDGTGWDEVGNWTPVADLLTAVTAAEAAATSATEAANSAIDSESSANDAAIAEAAAEAAQAAAEAAQAAAEAAASSVQAPVAIDTWDAPGLFQAGQGIPFSETANVVTMFVAGAIADYVVDQVPAVQAPAFDGQRLTVIVPDTATYACGLPVGTGMRLAGDWPGIPGMSIDLCGVTVLGVKQWFEIGRNK